jgi:GrpB-like predicted nucleotidyltransferase (UPF0157 family)
MRFLKSEEYQIKIKKIYADLSLKLSRNLPYAEIDHIGSSAIRGAVSKGDLDVSGTSIYSSIKTMSPSRTSSNVGLEPDALVLVEKTSVDTSRDCKSVVTSTSKQAPVKDAGNSVGVQ